VNTGPALHCPTALDREIKFKLIRDMLHLVSPSLPYQCAAMHRTGATAQSLLATARVSLLCASCCHDHGCSLCLSTTVCFCIMSATPAALARSFPWSACHHQLASDTPRRAVARAAGWLHSVRPRGPGSRGGGGPARAAAGAGGAAQAGGPRGGGGPPGAAGVAEFG
jgi:hypothetical protein